MSNPFEDINKKLIRIEETLVQLVNAKPQKGQKKYFSISEASKVLRVARITLYRRAQAGEIPIKRIGSRIMIPASYVESSENTDWTPFAYEQ